MKQDMATKDGAQAFWSLGDGRGEIRASALAAPGPDEVLAETVYSAVFSGAVYLPPNGNAWRVRFRKGSSRAR